MSYEVRSSLPDTPPHTPLQNSPRTASRGGTKVDARRPAGIHTGATGHGLPPLTPDASPHSGYASGGDSPPLRSPPSANLDVSTATEAVGLGFIGLEQKYLLSGAEEEKELELSRSRSRPHTPLAHSLAAPVTHPRGAPKTTLGHLLRVPRRWRPLLLAGTALFALVLVFWSRSTSSAVAVQPPARYLETPPVAGHLPPVPKKKHRKTAPSRSVEPIKLTAQDELLALIGFISSATGNSIPPNVDGSQPIDPQTLLGFDPAAPTAAIDLEILKEELNAQYPIVLLGRMRDPWQVELVRLLGEYRIVPAPLIIDADQRPDADRFIPAITRLLGTSSLPQLLRVGKPIATPQELLNMEETAFMNALAKEGSVNIRPLTKREKKGSGHGENGRQKAERERLLRPAPIEER